MSHRILREPHFATCTILTPTSGWTCGDLGILTSIPSSLLKGARDHVETSKLLHQLHGMALTYHKETHSDGNVSAAGLAAVANKLR